MTVPGGVPNLPQGALTLDNMASNLQDMTGATMKDRAVERFPSIMDNSTGLSPALDLSPFGILTSIFSEVNSLIANADPADVTGPEDIPALLIEFIEGLPVIGQFIDLLDAIMGTYTGDDAILLAVQEIFGPIRALMQMFAGILEGFPNIDQITSGVGQFLGAFAGLDLTDPGSILTAITNALEGILGDIVEAITGGLGGLPDLTAWAADIPILSDIVEAITGILGGGLPDLTSWAAGIPILGDLVHALTTGLLSGDQPVNALSIFGTLLPNLFSNVPIGALNNTQPNLVPLGVFPAGSIAASPDWSVDTAVTAAADSTGSAKVVANGSNHGLRGINIPVSAGQDFALSVQAKWSGLVSTGTPIQLGLVTYLNGAEVGRPTIASVASPGSTSAFQTLSGTYTVPDTGVDAIKVRIFVSSAATAGSVWFDAADIRQTGQIQMDWVSGLLDQFSSILDPIIAFIDSLPGGGLIGGPLSVLMDVFTDFVGLFGDPVGLGSGSPILGDLSDIPLLGPVLSLVESLIDELLSALGLGSLGTIFDKITSLSGGFGSFFSDFGDLGDIVNQVFAILTGGTVGTPINSVVTGIQTWFNGIANKVSHLNTTGLFDASKLTNIANIPAIAQADISGLVNLVQHLVPTTGLFDATKLTGLVPTHSVNGLGLIAEVINDILGLLRSLLSFVGMSGSVPADIPT